MVGFVTLWLDLILGTGTGESGQINSLSNIVLFVPSLAVAIRRLHDIGRSGWWWFTIFPPLFFIFMKGDEGPNLYGVSPLGEDRAGGKEPEHTKGRIIGRGSIALAVVSAIVLTGVWLFTGPVSGVKLSNEMDQYALNYIAEHGLLNPGEEVLAYYDVTMAMDGTEAAIVTTDRVIYHKQGHTTSIPMEDIQDVHHRYESFAGDIFEIQALSGRVMKIQIAPLNQGETFRNVLIFTWEKHKNEATGG